MSDLTIIVFPIPMVYDGDCENVRTIFKAKDEDGYVLEILNIGSHPCCYVDIPKSNSLFSKSYNEVYDVMNPNVHGGLTYSQESELDKTKWRFGWDYAHLGDYTCYSGVPSVFGNNINHKYSISELILDIVNGYKQLKKLDTRDIN